MISQPYIVGLLILSTINGIFSPAVILLALFVRVLMPAFFVESTSVVLYLSSLILATMTLIAGGIPAALYERWKGLEQSSELSMYIWLACTAILSLPAAINFFAIGL